MSNYTFQITKDNQRTLFSPLCIVILFCYIFSFYIIKPINSSMVVGLWSFCWLIMSGNFSNFIRILGNRFYFGLYLFLICLISLCFTYSILHGTYDISYASILIAQFIHLVFGVMIVAVILIKYKLTAKEILIYIIICYVLQSFIELAASVIPQLANFMKYFSSDDLQDRYNGVRGLALTSAAGWSLGLTFGVIFILYSDQILLKSTNIKSIGGLIILILGCFFAGRTGLFGLIVGILLYIIYGNLTSTVSFFSKVIITVVLFIFAIYMIFPEYIEFAINYILPFALEPVFNFLDGKGFTSKSTDRLGEMWDINLNDWDILVGCGIFTNPDGSYCRGSDVGILRNILYWGIGGYACLIAYQIYLMWPSLKNRSYRKMMLFVFIYLLICECKAVTIGLNKMTFSILFLISSFCYLKPINKELQY